MPIACRICITTKGLKGSDFSSLPTTDEELAEHMESVHHIPVVREGETKEQAQARFLESHPAARHCVECKKAGAPWVEDDETANKP